MSIDHALQNRTFWFSWFFPHMSTFIHLFFHSKKKLSRVCCSVVTSLVIPQLRLHTSNTGGTCLIPGQGTKIPRALQRLGQKNNKKFFKKEFTVLQVLDLVILKNEKPASVLQKLSVPWRVGQTNSPSLLQRTVGK